MTEGLEQYGGSVFYHDALAQVNSPCIFTSSLNTPGKHNLQFLAEANFFEMQPRSIRLVWTEVLDGLAHDVIAGNNTWIF